MNRGWSVWRRHQAKAQWVEITEGERKVDAVAIADRLNRTAQRDGSDMRALAMPTGRTPSDVSQQAQTDDDEDNA